MNVQFCIKAIISLALIASLLLSSVSLVYATDVILDSYTSGKGASFGLQDIHPSNEAYFPSAEGQSFKFVSGADKYYLKKCSFYLGVQGSPTGSLKAYLYAHTGTFGSGGKPIGSPLATSGSWTISFRFGMSKTVTFTFSSPYYELEKNTAYCIDVIMYSGSCDGSNFVKVFGDRAASSSHQGNANEFKNGVFLAKSQDIEFSVYGEAVPSAQWHDVVTWDFDLTTRAWSGISTWNFNLSTRQWLDVLSWNFNLNTREWAYIGHWIFNLECPSPEIYFPIGPILFGVGILVTLNAEPVDKVNITISGGPSNFTFWKMTDSFGEAIVRLKKGTYLFFISHDIYLVEHNISIMKHCTIHFELNSTEYRMVRDWGPIIEIVSGASCFLVLLAIYAYHEEKTVSKQWKKIKSLKGKPKKEIEKLKGKR